MVSMLRRNVLRLHTFSSFPLTDSFTGLWAAGRRLTPHTVLQPAPAIATRQFYSALDKFSACTPRASCMRFHQQVRRQSNQLSTNDAARASRQRAMASAQLRKISTRTSLYYLSALIIGFIGLSFLSVPLYKIFCSYTGIGGQIASSEEEKKRFRKMVEPSDSNRPIRVNFTANRSKEVPFSFVPTQNEVVCKPGETVLAFFTATNDTDQGYTGISTYTVLPYEAAQYFNKIQCFCFEEQRLNAFEEIDMPVFFYIDPDFLEDPRLEKCDKVTLSYTFFLAKPGLKLPVPIFKPLESDPVYGARKIVGKPPMPAPLPALGGPSGQPALAAS